MHLRGLYENESENGFWLNVADFVCLFVHFDSFFELCECAPCCNGAFHSLDGNDAPALRKDGRKERGTGRRRWK